MSMNEDLRHLESKGVRLVVVLLLGLGVDGFEDTVERTVSENARTLKFKDFGFEE